MSDYKRLTHNIDCAALSPKPVCPDCKTPLVRNSPEHPSESHPYLCTKCWTLWTSEHVGMLAQIPAICRSCDHSRHAGNSHTQAADYLICVQKQVDPSVPGSNEFHPIVKPTFTCRKFDATKYIQIERSRGFETQIMEVTA